ncbi:MAG TPA: nucleotidyl transferase AbiEii/AbiGii toxin family protein [Nocardioidaceae bacterium]|nr:nucleotidyl transferase AbiEii/AbiGii toxin family protein [Nocardioidaceae bacterium]
MSGLEEDRLSQFQVEIAGLFFDLPESVGFLLAGGGALIAQGLVHRDTDDLDFFATRDSGDVAAADAALTTAARQRGWIVEVIRTGTEFRRLRIDRNASDGEGEVFVDLALDSPPIGAPTVTIAGPSFPPYELAVRKTLALFGRAEPRDFTDVYTLHQHFDRDEILHAAAHADSGFDLQVFVEMLRSHRRLADDDFPRADVSVNELRAYLDAWAKRLEDRLT